MPALRQSGWVDSIPGIIGRLLHRYGWLAGVYLVIMGAGFTGLGALARWMGLSKMRDFLGG